MKICALLYKKIIAVVLVSIAVVSMPVHSKEALPKDFVSKTRKFINGCKAVCQVTPYLVDATARGLGYGCIAAGLDHLWVNVIGDEFKQEIIFESYMFYGAAIAFLLCAYREYKRSKTANLRPVLGDFDLSALPEFGNED